MTRGASGSFRRVGQRALAASVVALALAIPIAGQLHCQVLPGVDVLASHDFAELRGKRVGLVLNQTAVRRDPRQTTLDAFLATDRCRLVALFAPEHGIDGAVLAGDAVTTMVEPRSGLPIYSLYGATKKPTREMLRGIDVMVYDIQDIGVRSYTFISTLVKVMEGCADAGVPLVVLDRPNPIGGDVIDGPVLEPEMKSFVGIVPVPYVYGLTVGELATMANAERWLEGGVRCSLSVVRMQGWNRVMRWRQTGLQWIPASPHVPTPEAAFANAVTGAIGELAVASIGIGYTLPFELVGAPWLESGPFAESLNRLRIPGIYFRPTSYKPFYGMSAGAVCNGVQLIRTGEHTAPFTATVALLARLRDLHPQKDLFRDVGSTRWAMFDKVCGTRSIREGLLAGRKYEEIVRGWEKDLRRYIARREAYLLYE
jgi:uncharacterized protein YbbC (DUF1343 family)